MGQDGRLTALVKPDGGADEPWSVTFCVAWWHAQQRSRSHTEAGAATALFQYAPSTRAGCECVAYFMEALTDFNPRGHRRVSIDATGAHDIISRNAVLEGLLQMENGDQVPSFARNLYGRRCVRREGRDEMGTVHEIFQEEGGDALMSLLFRQHQAFVAIQARLHVGGEQREWEMSTRSCMKSSGRVPGSGCIKAGHRCGTEEVPVRPGPKH